MPTVAKRSLLDMIGYQKEAKVSKTLIDREAGSVTLHAIDRSQELGERTATFDVLVVVLEGEIELRVDGTSLLLGPNDSSLIPAGALSTLKAVSASKMLEIVVKS